MLDLKGKGARGLVNLRATQSTPRHGVWRGVMFRLRDGNWGIVSLLLLL